MTKVLAVVTARGGSKGLPRKNLAPLAAKPLIAWSIEAALGSHAVNRVVVSTDDEEIASVARRSGADVPFRRPLELATDLASGVDVVLHAVEWLESHQGYVPDVIVHLQPTSPLRTSGDIDAAVDLLFARKADAVVSVTLVEQHPFWMKCISPEGWLRDVIPQGQPVLRRQDLPPVFVLNGAIYAANRTTLLSVRSWYTSRTAAYVMAPERSIDIDTTEDLRAAEVALLRLV